MISISCSSETLTLDFSLCDWQRPRDSDFVACSRSLSIAIALTPASDYIKSMEKEEGEAMEIEMPVIRISHGSTIMDMDTLSTGNAGAFDLDIAIPIHQLSTPTLSLKLFGIGETDPYNLTMIKVGDGH